MPVTLWSHQQSFADWLSRRQYGYGAHEMGCGKTGSTYAALREKRLILVCCPIAVGPAWAKQGGLFDPSRKVVVVVSGSSASRAKKIREAVESGDRVAIIINYDAVWRSEVAKVVLAADWDAIVLDEAHRIKSPSSKVSKWIAKLAASKPNAKRICLSGTPTPQNPLDWWSQFRFLNPEILGGSHTAFRARIANIHPRFPGWVTGFKPEALHALRQRIDEHIHRVTSEEVLSLPDAIHETIEVEISGVTREFYDRLETEMIAFVGPDADAVTAANRMVVVGRLQAATSGFTRIDGEDEFTLIDGSPAKAERLRDWLTDFPAREPLVAFVRYIKDVDHVKQLVIDSGRTVSELSGRRKELEAWQAGETDVIVVQQQAGGCGVDLTRACYCVYFSLSHSLGDYEQSLARLRRPGQSKCCRYYHLVAKDTVDETIYRALRDKRDVVESVLARLTKRTEDLK